MPERWVPGASEAKTHGGPPAAYGPFGDGTRVCVGQRFAVLEAKITLLRLYQQCVISAPLEQWTCIINSC